MSLADRLHRRDDPHSLAAPYALDALEAAERIRFERHVAACPPCAAEVRALSEDAARLACSAAAPAPPALRDRVLAAVRDTPQDPAPAGPDGGAGPGPARGRASRPRRHVRGDRPPPARPRTARPRPLFVPFAATTAAAALVVAALFAVRAGRTQDELDAQRDRAREIAHVLAAPDARAAVGRDARGRGIGVIASAGEGRAVITLRGYPAAPRGRVRQLWVTRPGAQPRSLGLLTGETPLVASGLANSAASLAVTVEPEGGSARPSNLPIVQLALKSVGFGE
ncbi:anti-sigma factor domain-containing protein [Streptomyces sp. NPDC018610]|uniref:anti-sigma factor n=1 Tax=Streptomyces sp. NPDC018610 TaxID=3365049 RepID=UPI0037AC738F